jgi:hypothetical protein
MWRDRMQIETPARRKREQPIWKKTAPPGKQRPNDHDLNRGLERLASLTGH